MATLFAVAVDVGDLRAEESVGLVSDLVRRTVVHSKRLRPAEDIHSTT